MTDGSIPPARQAGSISTDPGGPLFGQAWVAVPMLTLGLGATVALSWFVFGGSAAFRGPLPALRESWPAIYGFQAVLAAAGTLWFARLAAPLTAWRLVGLIVAAWAGEWLVLFAGGRLIAGELGPEFAWFYWLIGTGGPAQPVAALLGGLLALRRPASAPVT